MRVLLMFGAATTLVVAFCFAVIVVQNDEARADYFDPDNDTIETSGTQCVTGHAPCDESECPQGCEKAAVTLTIKHHGAYWTNWVLQASGASNGVEGWWFENGNDEDEYAFGFNGGTGSVDVDFYIQTDGGGESIYVNLVHDDNDNDAFDAADELFDYFLLTTT